VVVVVRGLVVDGGNGDVATLVAIEPSLKVVGTVGSSSSMEVMVTWLRW
jgi:hypothetical protein